MIVQLTDAEAKILHDWIVCQITTYEYMVRSAERHDLPGRADAKAKLGIYKSILGKLK